MSLAKRPRRSYYAIRLSLGMTPAQARAASRRIAALGRRVARGEVSMETALASLGAL